MNIEIQDKAVQAVEALRQQQFVDAIELSNSVLEIDPQHTSAHAVKFSALFKAGRFEEARRIGSRAAELNPNSLFILNNQACLQLDANQPAAAAGLLRSLIKQFGERGQWLYNLALAHRLAGNEQNAIKVFERTLDIKANHDRAAFQLADCLLINGRLDEAVLAFNRVRLLRHTHAASHAQYIHHAVSNRALNKADLKLELAYWRERFIPKHESYPKSSIATDGPITMAFSIGAVPEHWLSECIAATINRLANRLDEVIVYWQNEVPTEQLFDEQVNVVQAAYMDDAQFAKKVRGDKVSALVDICGLRRGTRQRALGLQIASIQYGWMAHEGSYASDNVQLIEDHLYGVPLCLANTKTVEKKALAWPQKTLAAKGTHQGVSSRVIRTWATILHSLNDWNLHLDCQNSRVQKTISQQFKNLGVDKQRLLFTSQIGIDPGTIVLDNYINNDPVAIAQALRDGGLITAIDGDLFPAQRTAKLLSYFHRQHWLVKTPFEYLRQVVDLANSALNADQFEPISESQWQQSNIDSIDDFCDDFRAAILSRQ